MNFENKITLTKRELKTLIRDGVKRGLEIGEDLDDDGRLSRDIICRFTDKFLKTLPCEVQEKLSKRKIGDKYV